MKALPILFACLLSFHCSRSGDGKVTRDPLAEEVWQHMIAAEDKAQFSETLDTDLLAEHLENTKILRDRIPNGYPEPYLPYGRLSDSSIDFPIARNPFLNADIINLGRKLFFDEALSYSSKHGSPGGMSCSSCHLEDFAFTDNQRLSKGVDGDATHRNAPSILNSAYYSTLTWANPVFPVLEMQAKIPMFGNDPIELGLRGREKEIFGDLSASDPAYPDLFSKAFGSQDQDDYYMITASIAAYERSLIAFDTKFDRFLQGKMRNGEDLTAGERKGIRLFYGFDSLRSGKTLACAQCHAGPLMTDSFHYVRDGRYVNRKEFHNTGMNDEEQPFRTAPLRFVAKTFPYGHDGSLGSLEDVVRHYSKPTANSLVDPLVGHGFEIDDDEVNALVDFLNLLN